MKRWIHAATNQYKVLDKEDAKLLSHGAQEGAEYDEWSSWKEALEKIGHKYFKDPDEYEWFEQNSEQLYKVDQVDKLIAYELKNHEVFDITTDDYDDDEDDEGGTGYSGNDVRTEEWYMVMKGETSAEDTDGSPNYDSDDYLDCFDDIDSAQKYAEEYVDNYRHTVSVSIWKAISIHHDDDFDSDFSAELVKIVN